MALILNLRQNDTREVVSVIVEGLGRRKKTGQGLSVKNKGGGSGVIRDLQLGKNRSKRGGGWAGPGGRFKDKPRKKNLEPFKAERPGSYFLIATS